MGIVVIHTEHKVPNRAKRRKTGMSGISLLYAFVIVLQIIMPCKDRRPDFSGPIHQTQVSAAHTHTDAGHRDPCSPFCQCACCATPSIRQTAYIIRVAVSLESIPYREHLPGDPREVSVNIWQPPQLA